MYAQLDKTKENKSKTVANSVAQNKSSGKLGFGFVNSRPEAIMQRKIMEILNNRKEAKEATKFQAIPDSNSSQKTSIKRGDLNFQNESIDIVQRVLKTGGKTTDATTILIDAQLTEGYDVWKRNAELSFFEGVSSVIDITYAAGNIVVSIDGNTAIGSPFNTIGSAIDALNQQVFISLNDDVKKGLYKVSSSPNKNIRKPSGEQDFSKEYSDGKDVSTAVEEAISGLDLTGSSKAPHSRHDFQPSSESLNLQVQLGGSKGDYRRGKGDTSSTLVVVTPTIWASLLKQDSSRLKKIIQEAHRKSFNQTVAIHISE